MMQVLRSIGFLVVLLTLIAIVGGACGGAGSSEPPSTPGASTPMRVVVSLPVFVPMVQAIGQDRVVVTTIVPSGVDAHTYQPTPSDVQRVAEADVVFVNGAGLEEWLRPLIESAGGDRVPVYELAFGLTPIADNPHFWLDPTNAIHYARRIAQGLSERDPAGVEQYSSNADAYIGEIQAFDSWAGDQIAEIPAERRKLVTLHDAFPYFAAHYGLQLVGVVLERPGHEPSAQDLANLTSQIKAEQVPVIFAEPQFNPKLAETLAREGGIKTATLYSDTPPDGQDYLGMMRTNVQHVVEGLR